MLKACCCKFEILLFEVDVKSADIARRMGYLLEDKG